MSKHTFVIVGGGKMGTAILSGWLASSVAPADSIQASDIVVVEPTAERRAFLTDTYGVKCVASAADATDATTAPDCMPDVVVLAVKPQVMMGVLETITQLPAFQGKAASTDASAAAEDCPLFISIAAGLTTERIAEALPAGAPLVRVMPNMPLMVGAGASGVCGGANASEGQVHYVADLFGCLGRAVVVDESDMDAVCAVSGSGPAYVAAMVEAMRDAGAAQGLDPDLAEILALQTVLGTARLIDETTLTPQTAREAICSPGGTTLAALDAMNAAGFAQVIDAGIAAAVRRSKELAQS